MNLCYQGKHFKETILPNYALGIVWALSDIQLPMCQVSIISKVSIILKLVYHVKVSNILKLVLNLKVSISKLALLKVGII